MRWLEQNYGNTSTDNNEEQLEQLLALFGNGTGVTPCSSARWSAVSAAYKQH